MPGDADNERAARRRVTRRSLLGAGLTLGAGITLLNAPVSVSGPARQPAGRAGPLPGGFGKGMCYSALPAPYNPSTANTTCIFFGSDIAYDCMKALWGDGFTSKSGQKYTGRTDLLTLKAMGVTLLRLYDWEPRNFHLDFLNTCNSLGIKVLAPISNYFVKPDEGFPNRAALIPNLIRSFGNGPNNSGGSDYHPAIAGIIIGNEPRLSGYSVNECIEFTKSWVAIEQAQFPGFRQLPIGHPVDFATYGGQYPCWGFWDPLFAGLAGTTAQGLQSRLFLAPQTYNDALYLYQNAEGTGQGYVPLTYARYGKPLLFTEIGHDRTKPDYLSVIEGQIRGSIAFAAQNPDRLLGVCHFQYDDKVWLCPTGGACPSEGSFGVHSHSNSLITTVNFVPTDFTHFDVDCNGNQLRVDHLTRNPSFDVVVAAYSGATPTPTPKPTAGPTPTPPPGSVTAAFTAVTLVSPGVYRCTFQVTLGVAVPQDTVTQSTISGAKFNNPSGKGQPSIASFSGCANSPIPSPYVESDQKFFVNVAGGGCNAGAVIAITEEVAGSAGAMISQSISVPNLGSGIATATLP